MFARHYFSECERVPEGGKAWRGADFQTFGELMNQSCQNSISSYECGSENFKILHEIACSTSGVYGSRFTGGGYGGCVVALVENKYGENAAASIREKYYGEYSKLQGIAMTYLATIDEGLRRYESNPPLRGLRDPNVSAHPKFPQTAAESGGQTRA